MKNLTTCTFFAALLLLAGASGAQAQIKVGPHVGFDRYGTRYFIGVDARIAGPRINLGASEEGVPLIINPIFTYYFIDGPGIEATYGNASGSASIESSGTLYQLGGNVLIKVSELMEDQELPFGMYIGAGLMLSRITYGQTGRIRTDFIQASMTREGSDLVPGLNLLGGATFPMSTRLTPFVQMRITLAPMASVDLQKSVAGDSEVFATIPESVEYKSWGGTSFAAFSVGVLFGL